MPPANTLAGDRSQPSAESSAAPLVVKPVAYYLKSRYLDFAPDRFSMSGPELSHPYVPHFALARLYRTLFDSIKVEDGWAERVRELAQRGSVLYVLPNLNWLDFLALDYLTKRHGLPPIRYANDLGLWMLNPQGPNVAGWGLSNLLLPQRRRTPQKQLRDAITQGGSAALFLKRPPSVLDVASGSTAGRTMREGDSLVSSIFQMQREGTSNLLLLPMVFVWTKSPEKVGVRPWDMLLGPRAWPTPTRALGQFAYNRKHAGLLYGEEVEVGQVLDSNPDVSDSALIRRMTYMVLRRIERQRRTVVGPAEKGVERVRAEILRSPRLQNVISDLAAKPEEIKAKTAEADEMLQELEARPNADVVKAVGVALRWGFNRIYRGIEFTASDVDRVRQASRDGALILLPSHKSHIDYLVLSYFFYEQNLMVPVIAAGDNLNFQPVGPIFRRCGAFFIRRSFKGDRLYAAVVDAYVRRLIRDGYPIELFMEGGRSRTGKLLEPKLGLLNMIVDSALAVPAQKVHFVPVSIGYERVVEADSYQRELTGAEKKKEDATDLLTASEVLWHRYGRINLQFGTIMTLQDIGKDLGIDPGDMRRPAKRRAMVTRLGNRVMDEINRVTSVTPGALTALSLLSEDKQALAESELMQVCTRLLAVLRSLQARISSNLELPGKALREASVREALQMFVDAQILDVVEEPTGSAKKQRHYSLIEGKRLQLDSSKNIIIHFFVERALVAVSFDRDKNGHALPTDVAQLRERARYVSRLFKHEFRFRADLPFEDIFEQTIEALQKEGHVARVEQRISAGEGDRVGKLASADYPQDPWSGQKWLQVYRSIISAFLEGYLVAACSLEQLLSGPLSEKELIKAGLAKGHSMYLSDQIARRECISKPILQNAYQTFVELGYLHSRQSKIEWAEAYKSRDAVEELRTSIAGFLTGKHALVEDC